jgi:homoserine kinase type II
MDRNFLGAIVTHYIKGNEYQISPMVNGANNLSYKVKTDRISYLLRIYGNHSKIEKFLYENEILQTLLNQSLSFEVPAAIQTLENNPFVMVDGKLAAFFPFIEGEEANRHTINYENLGEKVAELITALQDCRPVTPAAYPPTYDLLNVHQDVNMKTLTEFSHHTLDAQSSAYFQTELNQILLDIPDLVSKLPQQIIHGDLMLSNVLLKEGKIAGILDFEFVSPDFRMTEVAVTISQLIREEADESLLFSNLADFVKGFCSTLTPLEDEIQTLPTLIKVRMVTLVFHFLGRYMNRLDSIDVVENQLKRFTFVGRWLDRNGEKLSRIFIEHKKLSNNLII